MRAGGHDAAVLGALRPLEVAAYLRASGWRLEADLNGRGSLWLKQEGSGPEFDVTLPARREMGDFVLRMAEVLRTLSQAEDRPELEVLRDVQTVTADLVRVRAPSREADIGTLPLDLAVSFVGHCRDLMLTAACAALDKRPCYAKRKPQQAMNYLSHVRMGQTERGSFVLTILSPVVPELRPPEQSTLFPIDPFERQVTRTLMDALKALDAAARMAAEQGDLAPFEAAVSRGVSANLCDAVAGLAAVSPDEGVEIQMSWSRNRPVAGGASPRVSFGGDGIQFIKSAAQYFREAAPVEDFEVEGVVTRLSRDASASDGEVTITGSVDGGMRPILLQLGAEAYRDAVLAHGQQCTVRCVGELSKERRPYRLLSPRHFQVLPSDDPS